MKNADINYDADDEMYDNDLGMESFFDIREYIIREYIIQKNININYEHNTSMLIASEEIKESTNIVAHNYDDDNEISIDVFIAIGEYMIERNMKYDLYLAEIKNNMNNVINQIKELNNNKNNDSNDDSDSDNIIHAYFYVSSDDPELSSEEHAANKYTDSDDLVYPGIHDN